MESSQLKNILEAGFLEIVKPSIDFYIKHYKPEQFRVLTDEELDWIDEKFPDFYDHVEYLKKQPFENREYVYISYLGQVVNIDTHADLFKPPFNQDYFRLHDLDSLIDYVVHDYHEALLSENFIDDVCIYSILKKLNKGRGKY